MYTHVLYNIYLNSDKIMYQYYMFLRICNTYCLKRCNTFIHKKPTGGINYSHNLFQNLQNDYQPIKNTGFEVYRPSFVVRTQAIGHNLLVIKIKQSKGLKLMSNIIKMYIAPFQQNNLFCFNMNTLYSLTFTYKN